MSTEAPALSIPRHPVIASTLTAIGYDRATQTLDVEMNSGAVVRHTGVPLELAVELMRAESIGMFYAKQISKKFNPEPLVETADEGSTPD